MNIRRIQRTLGSLLLVGLLASVSSAVVHAQSVNPEAAIAELDSIVETIAEMLEAAQGDPAWTNCLNPQLATAEAAVNVASGASVRLANALASGDSDAAADEARAIEDALSSARNAVEAASACEPVGTGETARTVRRTGDGTWTWEGTGDDTGVDEDPAGEFDETDGRGSVSTILQ